MPRIWRIAAVVMITAFCVTWTALGRACPYCPRTSASLCEKLAQSDIACQVAFVSTENGDNFAEQTTKFKVVNSLPATKMLKAGEEITIPIGVTGEPGDQFLLMGRTVEGEMEWNLPIPVDEIGSVLKYLKDAPSPERGLPVRLTYFWKYLDHKIPLISNDAFEEFSRANFNQVKQFSTQIDRKTLRKWIEDPRPELDVRRGFLGMLLGLCGNDDDARYLEKQIFGPIPEGKNRLGIDGMMAGFAMLRGQPGLQALMQKKVEQVPDDLQGADPRLTDVNAALALLRFLWDYQRDQFSEEVLRADMRVFLKRADYGESAIRDLARWKDWASIEWLASAYGKDPWDRPLSKQQVVQFALYCLKDAAANPQLRGSRDVEKAKQFLSTLDSAFVASVERDIDSLSDNANSAETAPKSDNSRE